MLEIKNNNLIIDGKAKSLNDINVINGNEKTVCIFVNMLVGVKKHDCSIKDLHKQLVEAGYNNFMLTNNAIINLNNIENMYIKYYQYAGISILESSKANAELCLLNLVCKNGKTESMSFNSNKEADKVYRTINDKLIDFKNAQANCNQKLF